MLPAPFSAAPQLALDAPKAIGRVELLVNRPREGVHQRVEQLDLDQECGILGDRWQRTAWIHTDDGSPDPRVQVSMTVSQVMACFSGEDITRCGDNLYVDFNLTEAHLPAGSILKIGSARLRVSDLENDACGKFADRFGKEALRFVREPANRPLRLRGIFLQIVRSGRIRTGDAIHKLS
ncbi:MAG: MOSC domain-containing protein [Coraliomargarita sp.]